MANHVHSQSLRLTDSKEFDRVFQQNKYRVSSPEVLLLALNNNMGVSRLGMVISKKVTKNAVNRNRIKRCIREAFRQADSVGLDIVVLSRRGINDVPPKMLFHLLKDRFMTLQAESIR